LKNKAKNLIIRTKRAVFNEYLANHPSLFDGDGLDFSELREYVPGEDAKKIDHIISAKKQKPYVKVYKSERELNIVVFSLLGGSIYFGTKEQKQETLAKIVSVIGVSTVGYQDRFSSYIYTNRVKSFIKPSKKLSFVTKAIEEILEFYPVGESVDFSNLEKEINRYVKKRALIFLVGDFLTLPPSLKKLNTKHEIIVIIVRDRFEESLAELSYIHLTDANNLKSLSLDLDKTTKQRYEKLLKEQDHTLYENLKRDRVRFTKIYSDENPIKNLKKLFLGR